MKASSPKEASWLGPAVVVTVLALSAGVGYFQFVYLPATQVREEIPPEWLNPGGNATVQIVPGASAQDSAENFVPKEIIVVLGLNNTVLWLNNDSAAHTVTSGTPTSPGGSADRGFDTKAGRANFLPPKAAGQAIGGQFTFTFTRAGEYVYHCVPHPWMRGRVTVSAPAEAVSGETNTTRPTTTTTVTETTNTTATTASPGATTRSSAAPAAAVVLPLSLAVVALPVRRPKP